MRKTRYGTTVSLDVEIKDAILDHLDGEESDVDGVVNTTDWNRLVEAVKGVIQEHLDGALE